MKALLIVLALVAGLLIAAALVFVGYGREKFWERVAGSPDRGRVHLMSVRRSSTANDAVASTAGLRADADIVLPSYDESPATLMRRIAQNIETIDPLARRVDDGTDAAHLRYVTYSPGMRFPDLVSVEAFTMEDGRTGLIAYARAQLGRVDFGANQERLQLYLNGL
jgi:hypothetical protein